jgi:ribonuclease/clavin/mitogillin
MLEDLPSITRLSSRVIRILGLNPSIKTLQGTNTYLIGTGNDRFLIDTGEGVVEYINLLSSVLEKENAKIIKVLLSHFHLDHVGGAKDIIAQKYKYYCDKDNISAFTYEHLFDGQEFQLVDNGISTTLRVIRSPGHTADHCSFLLVEENSLFSGDCVLGSGSSVVFDNLIEYMESLNKFLNLSPKLNRIYPGHGDVINDGYGKIQTYIDHRNQRENEITSLLQRCELDMEEIVCLIYANSSKEIQLIAKVPIEKHLEKLIIEKKVIFLRNGKYKLTSII